MGGSKEEGVDGGEEGEKGGRKERRVGRGLNTN